MLSRFTANRHTLHSTAEFELKSGKKGESEWDKAASEQLDYREHNEGRAVCKQ